MTRKIVVLDGHTLTPVGASETPPAGEPDWGPVAQHGDLTVYPRLSAEQANRLDQVAGDAAIVLTNKVRLSAAAMDALPKLEYIGVLATGTDIIDLDAARQRAITVTNAPGYSMPSVAQHVFALLMELTNQAAAHSSAVHAGEWSRCPDFSFTLKPIVELADKTLGIVGFGDIGQRVARIGHSLGMRIAVHSRTRKETDLPVDWLSMDDLFATADVTSLHCPLTEQTRHLVNEIRLASMKSGAVLINTGRGPLVDEAALAGALRDGEVAGAGLDVLSEEPPVSGSPLIGAPNCIITPHNAWASRESRKRLMGIVADNIAAYLAGNPTHVVNPVPVDG